MLNKVKFLIAAISLFLMVATGILAYATPPAELDFFLTPTPTPAEPAVPIVAGGYTIKPGGGGPDGPTGFSPPPGVCDSAAGSYLSEGIDALKKPVIAFDNIVYGNMDEETAYYVLYMLEEYEFSWTDALYDISEGEIIGLLGEIPDNKVLTIGDEYVCLADDIITARFWKLEGGGWALESLHFTQPFDLTPYWGDVQPPDNDPNQQVTAPDYPILVEELVIRYLMPYIPPPITVVPGAGGDTLVPNDAQLTACPGGAPSYLAEGANVRIDGYGYEKMPTNIGIGDWSQWSYSNAQFSLGPHGIATYESIQQNTPLTGIVGNLESVMVPPEEMLDGIKIGEVISGPHCTDEKYQPSDGGVEEAYGDLPSNRIYTWWEIKLQVDGQTKTGWYLESMTQVSFWLWEWQGVFPRKLFLYFMVPFDDTMQQASPSQQDEVMQPDAELSCQQTRFYAGLLVEPTVAALNRRETPGGAVIGRIVSGEAFTLIGEPECVGGTLWWQHSAGGWSAEYEPETLYPLFVLSADPTATRPPDEVDPSATRPPDESDPTATPRPTERSTVPPRPTDPPRVIDPTATRPPRATD